MAEQADVYVKNNLTDDIRVIRKLPGGGSDLDIVIAPGNEEQIYLAGTDVQLVVYAPEGADTKDCPFRVKSGLDLAVSCSRTDSNWTIRIVPNDLPPEVPTTVNVTVGDPGGG